MITIGAIVEVIKAGKYAGRIGKIVGINGIEYLVQMDVYDHWNEILLTFSFRDLRLL